MGETEEALEKKRSRRSAQEGALEKKEEAVSN